MSSIKITTKEQGLTYCRPEMRGQPPTKQTSPRWCPVCNHKIRGKNHETGSHHQNVVNKKVKRR